MIKKLFITILILVLILAGVFIFLFKPYETLKEERSTNEIKIIHAVFINYTGDDSCAKLYRYNNNDVSKITSPVFPALPEGMPAPDDGRTAYANNSFKLTGYDYKFVKRNMLTGTVESSESNRFDVISWEIVQPYKVWTDKTDKDGMLLIETQNKAIEYTLKSDNHRPEVFQKGNYIDCSK